HRPHPSGTAVVAGYIRAVALVPEDAERRRATERTGRTERDREVRSERAARCGVLPAARCYTVLIHGPDPLPHIGRAAEIRRDPHRALRARPAEVERPGVRVARPQIGIAGVDVERIGRRYGGVE